jgi:putative transposase
MRYKQTNTRCVARLMALRGLSVAQLAQYQALRVEAKRLWTDLAALHSVARAHGRWRSAGGLERATKGGQYAPHSQSAQALCRKSAATVQMATALRKEELAEPGHVQTAYLHHPKRYQTVIWKDQALQILPKGRLRLPTGSQRPPLVPPPPSERHAANLRRVELTWRADHYALCLTLDIGESPPPVREEGEVAGVDLGRGNIAAVTTARRHTLVVSGRMLRSCNQGRNKRRAAWQKRLSRCQPGSRRAKRLLKRKAQLSAKLSRQQRDILHQAAQEVVNFCTAEGVSRIAVGDVRDTQIGVSLGRKTNQKISQWPHGRFARYLREKAARLGVVVEWIDEAYSTSTCSQTGHIQSSSPRGRRFRRFGCRAQAHRAVNGANTICSRAAYGRHSAIQADTVKYLRPLGVAPWTRAVSG